MEKEYDGIIIGAGHNGLICAGYLAKAGLKILIVERHLVNIYRKIGARNRADATAYAFLHGLAERPGPVGFASHAAAFADAPVSPPGGRSAGGGRS